VSKKIIFPFVFILMTLACNMEHEKIKKTLNFQGLSIRLYEVPDVYKIPYKGLANIKAFDANDNLVWTVETPQSPGDSYFNIKLDTVNNILIAYTGLSFMAKISLENGKILDFRMIK
jgi:hypothetical protein